MFTPDEPGQEVWEGWGEGPAPCRNMHISRPVDIVRLPELEQAVRLWLAWKSIEEEKEQLNLDPVTERQVKKQVQSNEDTITERIRETFCHLLVPSQEGTDSIDWQSTKLQGDNLVSRAS